MAEIRLAEVTKSFGAVTAVDGVSLDIADGEFLVLVGPSGCGKSTLLRMLAGLEDVTSGEIWIGDRDVTDLAPRSRDIAMVFQTYALYPHMTVRQNMGYGLKARRTPKPEIARRVDEVAELLGLADLLDRKPAQLSGGQRQRVAMGRAIVRQPRAFLLDEPLSNLDAKLRVGMRASLAQLHHQLGVTTVYVTHDQTEAMTLGQRVAVIRDGTVQQCDTPQALFDRPNNLFVAAFIGSPAMNLVAATVEDATIRFADIVLPLAEEAAVRGQRRDVILGIRPTDFELPDRAADPALPRIRVAPEVIEGLGAETNVIFPLAAPRVDSDTVRSAAEGGDVGTLLADDDRALFTARIATRTPLAQNGPIELVVHNASMHFFDPETGAALR